MLGKVLDVLWTWLLGQWGVISAAPAAFCLSVTAISVIFAYVAYLVAELRYQDRLSTYQATIQLQATELANLRGKQPPPTAAAPSLRLSMVGANVFIPDQLPNTTGVAAQARIWNVGTPIVAVSWTLAVMPDAATPTIAPAVEIPDYLRLAGSHSAVIRSSDAIDTRTREKPVGTDVVSGTVMFLVPLPQEAVVRPSTVWELTVTDANGAEAVSRVRVGDLPRL